MTRPTRRTRRRRRMLALALAGGTGVVLSGCGSDSMSSSGDQPSTSAASQTSAADLAAKLPEKIRTAGSVVVGTDSSYAPNEFLDADGKTITGMDVDLFNAVAQQFGVKVEWQSAGFDSIITGVKGGKYDMGISSFTINAERKAQVNMVSYFNAGTLWAAAPGNPKQVDPDKPCGLAVAVQKGTTQHLDDLPAKIAACKSEGKPIRELVYAGQDQATAAVASGKADAMLADSPVVAYAAKQSGGKIEAVGQVYDAAPYGYVLPKDQTEFAQALVDALEALAANGTYRQVLTSWGNQAGAISDFAVNP